MKRGICIAIMCLSAVLCCTMGTLYFREAFAAPKVVSEPKETEPVRENREENISIAQGSANVLALNDEDFAALTGWHSDDKTVVSVDNGGRIDALKKGTVNITAAFDDGHHYIFHVTVTAPEAAQKADTFSTAIVANQDILQKNLKSKNKSKLPFQIMVNRQQNCVTVYTYDSDGKYTVPVRAMVCSCGIDESTVLGIYNIYFRDEWLSLVRNSFGQYTSGFYDDFLFHSVPYTDIASSTLKVDEFNKLGDSASAGCVRLAVADCKWIYDNCVENTAVAIFDDENPGPLGKPETIKITDAACGWDPTDSNAQNPYNSKKPRITGAKDVTVKKGGSFDVADGVTALDTCDNDITEKMEIIGNPNTNIPGKYTVTYSVTDVLHRSATVSITVTVEE